MRQAGLLAAAGRFALKNNIERLTLDHKKAKHLANILQQQNFVEELIPVATNILIFKLKKEFSTEKFIQHFATNNIKIVSAGVQTIRLVMHLDVTDIDVMQIEKAIINFKV